VLVLKLVLKQQLVPPELAPDPMQQPGRVDD
jgi:hypothetical protein